MCQHASTHARLRSSMWQPPTDDSLCWLEERRLLSVLSRSPCALAVTGKDQQHWRRMENACSRLQGMQQQQRRRQRQAKRPSHAHFEALLDHSERVGAHGTTWAGLMLDHAASSQHCSPQAFVAMAARRKWLLRRHFCSAILRSTRRILPPSSMHNLTPPFAGLADAPAGELAIRMWDLRSGTPGTADSQQHQVASRRSGSRKGRARRPFARKKRVHLDSGAALPAGHPLLLPGSDVERLADTSTAHSEAAHQQHVGEAELPAGRLSDSAGPSAMSELTLSWGDLSVDADAAHDSSPAATLGLVRAMVAGSFSGALSRAVVHPIDTLRVLQSVSSVEASATILKESSADVPVLQRISAAGSHWMQTTARALKDGRHILGTAYHNWHLGPTSNPFYDIRQLRNSARILYRGLGVSVCGAVPVYGVYFATYETIKAKIADGLPADNKKSSLLVPLSAGFLSECVAIFVWNPWDVIRQRMQLAGSSARSFTATAQDVMRESGARGFMVGSGAYMALWGCYSPLMFLIYEQGIDLAYRNRANPELPAVPSLVISVFFGSIAGSLASIITSPLDVVKTRIQCQTPASITRYDNVMDGLREVYRNEGFAALFRGLAARSSTMGISCGVMLGCYGFLRPRLMQNRAMDRTLVDPTQTDGFIPQIRPPWSAPVQAVPPLPSEQFSTNEACLAKGPLMLETRPTAEQSAMSSMTVYPPTATHYIRRSSGTLPADERFSDGFIPPLPNPIRLLRDKLAEPK